MLNYQFVKKHCKTGILYQQIREGSGLAIFVFSTMNHVEGLDVYEALSTIFFKDPKVYLKNNTIV